MGEVIYLKEIAGRKRYIRETVYLSVSECRWRRRRWKVVMGGA